MNNKVRITYNAPVVLTFGIICFVALILNYISGGITNQAIFSTYHSPMSSPMTYVRFITHACGHADFAHFIGNMSYILLLGPLLEEKYGSVKLIIVMVLTAVVAGVTNYIFFPHVAVLGASGIVFAFIILSSITSYKEKEIPLTFILVIVIYLGQQVFEGLFVQNNVSNLSHILGGIVGAVFGFVVAKNSLRSDVPTASTNTTDTSVTNSNEY